MRAEFGAADALAAARFISVCLFLHTSMQGLMYDYKGNRSVEDLHAFATGGWQKTTGKVDVSRSEGLSSFKKASISLQLATFQCSSFYSWMWCPLATCTFRSPSRL